ncbi:MAG TPA: hypothetical protein VMT27_08600 [Actinomycetes bacterium]|nr:hypothetical protein [Actinomycetes bacterium]
MFASVMGSGLFSSTRIVVTLSVIRAFSGAGVKVKRGRVRVRDRGFESDADIRYFDFVTAMWTCVNVI